MNRIYYLCGKSATGKDTVQAALLNEAGLSLKPVIPYTSRPMREGEKEGDPYFFLTIEKAQELIKSDRLVEYRVYETVHGPWYYLTIFDEQFQTDKPLFMVGTLQSLAAVKAFFGEEAVVSFYLTVPDRVRLSRAILREDKQDKPCYAEVCRRYLADEADFSKENLEKAGISYTIENKDLTECVARIRELIWAKEAEKA